MCGGGGDLFNKAGKTFGDVFKPVISKQGKNIGNVLNKAISESSNLVEKGFNTVEPVANTAANIVGNIPESTANAISDPAKYAKNYAKSIADNPEKLIPIAAAAYFGMPEAGAEEELAQSASIGGGYNAAAETGAELSSGALIGGNISPEMETSKALYSDIESPVDFETPVSSDITTTDYSGLDTSGFETPEAPYSDIESPVDFGDKSTSLKEGFKTARNIKRGYDVINKASSKPQGRIPAKLTRSSYIPSIKSPTGSSSAVSPEQKQKLQNVEIVQIINKYARMGRDPWKDTAAQQEMQKVANKYL